MHTHMHRMGSLGGRQAAFGLWIVGRALVDTDKRYPRLLHSWAALGKLGMACMYGRRGGVGCLV